MMRQFLLGLSLQLLFLFSLQAQTISGTLHDEQGKPVNSATVSLLRSGDSAVVKLDVSKEGLYQFQQVLSGTYLVSASYVGYQTVFSLPFAFDGADVNVPVLQLDKIAGDMKAVIVTAKKPMVQVKADRTILNVEGTINSVGSDALELLRKSPGVMVDKDDNLRVSGKTGVQVYVDGRPSPLAGKDLSDYLKSLQASQIEAIEIITNPSARYEAAGNAGIINIRLKKNKAYGTNGSVTAGYNIGTHGKYNAGISLNHRSKKINLFGNYAFNHGLNKNGFNLYRVVMDTLFDQRSSIRAQYSSHNFKSGMDYTINAKNVLGVMVSGTYSAPEVINSNITPISFVPAKTVNRIMVADNRSVQQSNNTNVNLNYGYTGEGGKSLTVNADYGIYNINNDQVQPNYFFDAVGEKELHRAVYHLTTPTDINIYSVKTDYEQNLKKGKLGIGGKTAFVQTDNDLQQFNVYGNLKELDQDRSNHFRYRENIHAGYINYSRAFEGVLVQGGLRVENTALEGISKGVKISGNAFEAYRTTFSRSYTDFFPSAAVTFNKNPQNVLGFSYSRRIDRPVYKDLNPFEYKINEYTFHKGNINMRPQYTNSFSVTHTYQYKLNTTLNYSHVKDMFAQVVDTAEGTKGFLSNRNLASQDMASLNVSFPFQYKAYSLFTNVNTYYSRYQADYGPGRSIDQDVLAFSFYAQNTYKLTKSWTLEVSGFYNSPTIWQGSMKSKAMWGVDGGVQKQVWNGKATVKASVSDLFGSMKWEGSNYFAGQYIKTAGTWESRQLKLAFTYRFGNSGVKAARQRTTGAEEESKRVQSGSGNELGH